VLAFSLRDKNMLKLESNFPQIIFSLVP